jgi:hypothetical protein
MPDAMHPLTFDIVRTDLYSPCSGTGSYITPYQETMKFFTAWPATNEIGRRQWGAWGQSWGHRSVIEIVLSFVMSTPCGGRGHPKFRGYGEKWLAPPSGLNPYTDSVWHRTAKGTLLHHSAGHIRQRLTPPQPIGDSGDPPFQS